MKPGIVLAAARSALKRKALAAAVNVLMLAPAASYALELGEATIVSGLGQSLLVEIPYRLSAGEQLTPACIGLAPALRPAGALPTYTRATRVTVTSTHIEIFGDSRVVEPLIGLNVDVRCESTPRFVRSYELFVDPPVRMPTSLSNRTQPAPARVSAPNDTAAPVVETRLAPASTPRAATATSNTPVSTEAPRPSRANTSLRARGQVGGTLTQGETYVVVRGDTLSGIASRVGDRPTIRETADAIFAANASAFTRGNRDLLEAGRSIIIPLLTAAPAALPAAPAAIPAPVVSEAAPLAAPPAANVASPAPSAAPQLPAASAPSPAEPVAVAAPAAAAANASVAAEPAEPAPVTATAQTSRSATSAIATPAAPPGRSSVWLTALLALGAAILLSSPLLFIRRRKPQPAAPNFAKPRSSRPRHRQLVDPVAGFDVVEGDMPHTDKPAAPQRAASPSVTAPAHAPSIEPTDSVDLDVGTPVVDERVDWFSDRTAAAVAPVAQPTAPPAAIQNDATARMPELDDTATAQQAPLDEADPTLDDKQHTLTIVELDMLRQDYETEHTLTQQTNKELRDALADLKATQAALGSNGDTATLEVPQQEQPDDGELESRPTQKVRSSR